MNLQDKRFYLTLATVGALLIVLSSSQNIPQPIKQAKTQSTSLPNSEPAPIQPSESLYTQDIQEFKSKKYNQRLEGLVGCWLMSKEYLNIHKSNYLFFKDLDLKEIVSLKLVKECLKKVTRKQAIVKITELVGKNMQPAKRYQDIIDISIVNGIFDEVSKLTIANYNQYQPINHQPMPSQSQSRSLVDQMNKNVTISEKETNQSEQSTSEQNRIRQSIEQNQQQQHSDASITEQTNQVTRQSFTLMSEFDLFLVELLEKYNDQFQKLATSKQGLKGRVEQELKKRQKYYFGIIPASSFTHSVFLVTISLSMVFCCTCFKYYKMRTKQSQQKRIKKTEECEDNCRSHSHPHLKDVKKFTMTKMTQMTMKKKIK